MDRQDAKPRRPSLMAGAPSPVASAPSPARILADMDGGQPAPLRARPLSKQRSLTLAAVVIGLLGSVLWWQSGSGNAADPGPPGTAGIVDVRPGEAFASSHAGAATIIDEPSPAADRAFAAGAENAGAGPDPNDTDPLASPFAKPGPAPAASASGSPDHANPFSPAHAATAPGPAARAAPHAAARPGKAKTRNGNEPDLMATLLGNIKAQEGTPASGLDSLIRKMETEQTPVVARSDPAAAAHHRSRSQQIQNNLRECPPANTAKGLKCRQAICAVYAGRDPACPAN